MRAEPAEAATPKVADPLDPPGNVASGDGTSGDVVVIIVNHNTAALLADCRRSLAD